MMYSRCNSWHSARYFYIDEYIKRFANFRRSANIYFLPSMTKHQKIYLRRKRKNDKALDTSEQIRKYRSLC